MREEPVEQEAPRRVGERLEHTVVIGHLGTIGDRSVTCQIVLVGLFSSP
jgi:hypothetical protein